MIPLLYPKPLSLADRTLIDCVTTRYEGVESQWVAFEREDYVELMCPERIRGVIPSLGKKPDANEITASETSPLRIPSTRRE